MELGGIIFFFLENPHKKIQKNTKAPNFIRYYTKNNEENTIKKTNPLTLTYASLYGMSWLRGFFIPSFIL